MSDLPAGAAYLSYDETGLHAGPAPGRQFMIDERCLTGEPVRGAYVCALTDPTAAVTFDQPEIQQARRDALAWWIGLLGAALVAITTLALDEARYGGAITVTRAPVDWNSDPFARIYPGTVIRTSIFSAVLPPPDRSSNATPALHGQAAASLPGPNTSSASAHRCDRATHRPNASSRVQQMNPATRRSVRSCSVRAPG